jgi:hypothetical protein
MSLHSPSRASRTIPEPCRSFLTRCFRLSFHQQAGLYLRVAAPSLPLRSPACRMILAVFDLSHVYRASGCLCSRLHETVGRFHSLVAHQLFRCLSFHQPAGQYLRVAAPSLSSLSPASPASVGVSRRSPPEIASLDPVEMVRSPPEIGFLGPVGVFSMSPPNFAHSWPWSN